MKAFGLPTWLQAKWIGVALPVIELLVAVSLLVAPSYVFTGAAVGATLLLVAFVVITGRAVRDRLVVDCNCFGSLSNAPVDRFTVIRNIVFAGAAAAVALAGGEGAALRLATLDSTEWVAFFCTTTLVLGVALVATLARSRTPRPAQPASIPVTARDGSEWPIPDVEVTDSSGRAVTLSSLSAARPTLLLIVSADCDPCRQVIEMMPRWQLEPAVGVAIITSASPELFESRYPHVTVPMFFGYRSLLAAAEIGGVPSALLLGTNRMVAAGPAQGRDEVVEMASAISDTVSAMSATTYVLPQ
jgi:hypothetical protein